MPKYLYLLAYTIPLFTLLSLVSKGVLTFAAPIFAFVFLPVLEFLLPLAKENFSKEQEEQALKSRFYDYITYSMLPIQYGLILLFSYMISTSTYSYTELFGMTFSLGIACGVLGINVGHELGHRVKKSEQLMAKLLLSTSWYSHFFIEHNKGHHKNVATPHDPASAHLNQNVFSFWVQSLRGSFLSALSLEKKRLAKSKKSFFWQNEVIRWKLVELSQTLVIFYFFGVTAAVCFVFAALIGALLLECVNYIEHYGLHRSKLSNGRYERVTPHHSWNSDHPLGRTILFDLSRHSDHHANPGRKYQVLRSFHHECPQFPTGYPGMIVLSLIPPLWFRVMNRRVSEWVNLKKMSSTS